VIACVAKNLAFMVLMMAGAYARWGVQRQQAAAAAVAAAQLPLIKWHLIY
jgi:hypothetical protein